MTTEIEFSDWITIGIKNGWCGAPVCSTHDGIPQSREEDEAWEEGSDPCVHIVRLYSDKDEKTAVEENHAPSVWRDHYTR
jgi:hypothetical protein